MDSQLLAVLAICGLFMFGLVFYLLYVLWMKVFDLKRRVDSLDTIRMFSELYRQHEGETVASGELGDKKTFQEGGGFPGW